MRMLLLLFALVIFLARPAAARCAFSDAELSALWGYTALHVIDWRQTLDIKNYADIHETNPILGESPSDSAVSVHFALTLAFVWGAACNSPKILRPWFIGSAILLEFYFVENNASLGLSYSF